MSKDHLKALVESISKVYWLVPFIKFKKGGYS